MRNTILFISPHPDDETLACGGTILKHRENGDKIYWLIATCIKEKDGFSKEAVLKRKNEIRLVSKAYGFDIVYQLGISTKKVDEFPMQKMVGKISKILNEVKANIIYLPFREDVHSDHRVIFEAAYSCTKIFRYPFIRKILMMETISETETAPSLKECVFIPNYFVDISNFMNKKLKIMNIYKSELGEHPFPRNEKSIKALAIIRGSQAGCKYAEGFMLLKEID